MRRSRASSPPGRHRHQAAARDAGRERERAEAEQVGDVGVAQREQVLGGEIARGRREPLDARAAGSAVVGSSTASKPAVACGPGGADARRAPRRRRHSRRRRSWRRRGSGRGPAANISSGLRLDLARQIAVGLGGEEQRRERERRRRAAGSSRARCAAPAAASRSSAASKAAGGASRAGRASGLEDEQARRRRGVRPRGRARGAPERAASDERRVLDRAAERADGVEVRAERHHAVEREQAVAWSSARRGRSRPPAPAPSRRCPSRSPAAARPKATEAAAPEEEPPGASSGSLMLGGVAVTGLTPRPEKASSVRWVLPRQTRPARVAVARTAASRSGTRPASSAEPASVAMPAVSTRSFQLIGTPSSGPRRRPARGAGGGGVGLGAGALGRGAGVDAGAVGVAVDRGEVGLGQLARVDRAGLDPAAELARRHPEPGVGHRFLRLRRAHA